MESLDESVKRILSRPAWASKPAVPVIGAFDKLSEEEKNVLLELHSHFYYRTGFNVETGEWGKVKILPSELRDLLAVAFKLGWSAARDDCYAW